MGQEEAPGHVQTGGDRRAEGKGGGLEEDGEINLRKNLDGTRGPLFVKRALERHPYTNIFDAIIPRSINCLNLNRICNQFENGSKSKPTQPSHAPANHPTTTYRRALLTLA